MSAARATRGPRGSGGKRPRTSGGGGKFVSRRQGRADGCPLSMIAVIAESARMLAIAAAVRWAPR